MGNRTAGSLVFGATLFAAFFVRGALSAAPAHAAPGGPNPGATPADPRIQTPVMLKAPGIEVEPIGGVARCGEPVKQKVTLINKTGKPWKGTVAFSAAGSTKEIEMTIGVVAGVNGGDRKTGELTTTTSLDCTKPLGTFDLRVTNDLARGPFYSKAIKVVSVKAEQGFSPPAPNDTVPWLRRVTASGNCGGPLIGTVGLHAFSSTPKPAKVKLALGAATKEETAQVQSSNTFVSVETPLDCAAALPSFDYALLDGRPTSGKLASYELTLSP